MSSQKMPFMICKVLLIRYIKIKLCFMMAIITTTATKCEFVSYFDVIFLLKTYFYTFTQSLFAPSSSSHFTLKTTLNYNNNRELYCKPRLRRRKPKRKYLSSKKSLRWSTVKSQTLRRTRRTCSLRWRFSWTGSTSSVSSLTSRG